MSKVLLIYTGGTIGMVENPVTGAHEPLDFNHLACHVPELSQLKVDITTLQLDPPIDSSNMNPELWKHLVHIIADHYETFDGFVVLHGTDTMAYTASALSYMLQNIAKPVILTGSQLPIGVLRTDGKENLITSIEIASTYDKIGLPLVPEVCVYFQGTLIRGNRCKKQSSEEFNAFISPNYTPLARVGVHVNWAHHHILFPNRQGGLQPHYQLCTDVAVLKLYPGIPPFVVHGILSTTSLRGVILETYGAGNAMTYGWFIDELKAAVNRGIVIVNVSQCMTGAVEMSIYDTGNQLSQAGVISAGDMTFEAAIVKLMFLLGQGYSQAEVCKRFKTSIAGEIS